MNRNRRRIGILAGLGIIILTGLLLSAGKTVFAEEEGEVLYSNDFEKEDDVSGTPTTNTEYKINFKGLTDEKAHSGEKSFKIDFTVKGGHFCYWRRHLNIPLTEDITFSGYLFRSEENESQALLRIGVFFPKAKTEEGKYVLRNVQCRAPAVSGISSGRWCQFFADSKNLYEHAKNYALKQGWDYTDMYIAHWYLHIVGGGGKWKDNKERKIVVYVDDVSINREEAVY